MSSSNPETERLISATLIGIVHHGHHYHNSTIIIPLTLQVVRFLLEEAGAKINLETTLSVAAGYGDLEIVR